MPRNNRKRNHHHHHQNHSSTSKFAAYQSLLEKNTPLTYEPAVRFLRREFQTRDTSPSKLENCNTKQQQEEQQQQHIKQLHAEIDGYIAILSAKLRSFYLSTTTPPPSSSPGFSKGSSSSSVGRDSDYEYDDTFLETPFENLYIAYQQVLDLADTYFIDTRNVTRCFQEVRNAVNVMGYRPGFPHEQWSWRSASLIQFRFELHKVLNTASRLRGVGGVPRKIVLILMSFFRRLEKK